MRLKTGLWVDALIRRAQAAGAFACVVVRGDRDAGSVLVTVRGRDGLLLLTPERDMQGERVWRPERMEEPALSERIEQRVRFDADLMVVEIDDPSHAPGGRHFIEEPVLELPEPSLGPGGEAKPPPPGQPAARPSPQEGAADAAAAARALFRDPP